MMTSAPRTLQERRAAPRLIALTPSVAFPGAVQCTITEISASGARVQCADTKALGDFPIIVEWATGRAHDCVVVWRDDSQAGVRFLRSCPPTGAVPAPFTEAREAWLASRMR